MYLRLAGDSRKDGDFFFLLEVEVNWVHNVPWGRYEMNARIKILTF